MSPERLYPRFVEARLVEALTDTPVVLIHGPRQCGKTTLARMAGIERGYSYFTFDDDVVLAGARADPTGFVSDLPERVILDEAQRAPEIFTAIKVVVDRDRTPGRFLLTGSANVMFAPKLTDSLAGRMEIISLHPLAQCELAETQPDFIERLFANSFAAKSQSRLGVNLRERIVAGGYPVAIDRRSDARRRAWHKNYIEALVAHDVRELARVRSLDVLPRLSALLATQTARLLNVSELASPFELSRPTIAEYVTLLERLFLIARLPPWHSNRLSRLVKTPKVHFGDTGLACALLGIGSDDLVADRTALGQLVETFVFQELLRQASWQPDGIRMYHFRDKDGAEVDIVLEHGAGRVAGVEVKAGATVTSTDFRGMRRLSEALGPRFAAGVVLYDGEVTVSFGGGMHAVPIRTLWATP